MKEEFPRLLLVLFTTLGEIEEDTDDDDGNKFNKLIPYNLYGLTVQEVFIRIGCVVFEFDEEEGVALEKMFVNSNPS